MRLVQTVAPRDHDPVQPAQSTLDHRRGRTAATGAAVAVALAGSIVAAGIDAGQHAYRTDEIIAAFANCVAALVGAVVALSVPGNLIGWLLVGGAAAADLDRLLDDAVAELGNELDLRDIAVRDLDGATVAGAATSHDTASIPLQVYGATVGWLDYRRPDRELSASEQRLVTDLASHLAPTCDPWPFPLGRRRESKRLPPAVARQSPRRSSPSIRPTYSWSGAVPGVLA